MTKGKKIGKGFNGTAFLIQENESLVMKVTKSKKEILLADRILKLRPSFFCKIISINKNIIIKEKVKPIEDIYGYVSFENVIWDDSLNMENYKTFGLLHLIVAVCRLGLPIRILKQNLHSLKGEDLLAAQFIIDNESALDEFNVDYKDIHCNLGYDTKGRIVLFDADSL